MDEYITELANDIVYLPKELTKRLGRLGRKATI